MFIRGNKPVEEDVNDDPKAHKEPSMREIFKPGQRVGKDNAKKPAPQQPTAKQRFKIGKEY